LPTVARFVVCEPKTAKKPQMVAQSRHTSGGCARYALFERPATDRWVATASWSLTGGIVDIGAPELLIILVIGC